MKLETLKIYVLFVCSVGVSQFNSGFINTFNIAIFPTIIGELSNSSEISVNGTSNSSYNYAKLGFLFASKGITVFLFSPIWGLLIDRFTPPAILLSGFVMRCCSLLIFIFTRQYYFLVLSRLIEGCSTSSTRCALDSIIAYHFNGYKVLGFLYGVYHLCQFIGMSVGPVVGGLMDENYGRKAPFLLGLLLTVCEMIAVVVLFFKGKYKKDESTTIEVEKETLKTIGDPEENITDECKAQIAMAKVTRKDPLVRILVLFLVDGYVILILLGLSLGVATRLTYFTVLPRYMLLRYGACEFKQGVVFLLNIVGYTVGFFVGSMLNVRLKRKRYVILMVVGGLFSATVVSMAFMPVWWAMALPLCMVACFTIVLDIVISPIFAAVTEKRHGGKFGIMSGLKMMNVAAMSVLCSMMAPTVYGKVGFLWLNLIVAFFILISTPMFFLLKRFS